jgi:hypothetical protein
LSDQVRDKSDQVEDKDDDLIALADEIRRITAPVEARLTHEEQEALAGFAMPTPRRTRLKTGIPWLSGISSTTR